MNILFGDNHVQSSWNWKKGRMPWDTCTTLVLKIWLKKILLINFHQKMSHIYIQTSLHPILQTFTVRFLRYLKLCFSWMAPRKNEIVDENYYTLILCCFFICEIPITKRNAQIIKLLQLSFLFFRSVGEGKGWKGGGVRKRGNFFKLSISICVAKKLGI